MGLKSDGSLLRSQETGPRQTSEAVGKYNLVCVSKQVRWDEASRRGRRTSSKPFEVWMTIDGEARFPMENFTPLRIVGF